MNNPAAVIRCNSSEDFADKLVMLDEYKSRGFFGIALISYETAYILQSKLKNLIPAELSFPFLQFYFYEKKDVIEYSSVDIDYTTVHNTLRYFNDGITNFHLNTSKEKYLSDVEKIRSYIEEGDTYQVNYTVKGHFNFKGDASSFFMNLIFNQSAEYSAIVNTEDKLVLTISPELFFRTKENIINTKPMKGTIRRGYNEIKDSENRECLSKSIKDKAENVMIVDLLRNDMGRISHFGSVDVKSLFDIEKYETVFQMTSEIKSLLKVNNLSEILYNIFPCGSITGAPKIRTMEIISELEHEQRNIYTGSIGLLKPDEDIFNVAIRTIVLDKITNKGEIGIGSGIVWDSRPEDEYSETLLKCEFLTKPSPYFELFETILFEDGDFFLLDYHLERLRKSADFFLFKFDEEEFQNILNVQSELFTVNKNYKIKISLNKWGSLSCDVKEFQPNNSAVKILLSSNKISSDIKLQYFKTTHRPLYDREREDAISEGYFDVIYSNEKSQITEGSITNIFMRTRDLWITPPLDSGILDGCYRKYFLANKNNCIERNIDLYDLINSEEVKLVNSLRKEIKVKEIWAGNKKIKSFDLNIS